MFRVVEMPRDRWLYNSSGRAEYHIDVLGVILKPGELIAWLDVSPSTPPSPTQNVGPIVAFDADDHEIVLGDVRVISVSHARKCSWLRGVNADRITGVKR